MDDLVERCYVCKTIVLDGTLVNKRDYDSSNFDFTDSLLSRDCAISQYGLGVVEKMESLRNPEYRFESCSEKTYK